MFGLLFDPEDRADMFLRSVQEDSTRISDWFTSVEKRIRFKERPEICEEFIMKICETASNSFNVHWFGSVLM
jgi:hypothetical protein